jgi:hypothetical protein
MKNCVNEILKAIPDADRDDVQAIVNQISELRNSHLILEGLSSPESKYREKAMNILNGYRRAAMKAEIKTLQNISKRKRVEAFLSQPVFEKVLESSYVNLQFTNPKMKALEAKLSGTNLKGMEGSRLSVGAIRDGYAEVLGRGFLAELTPEEMAVLNSGHLTKEIYIDWVEIANNRPPKSGSETAAKIGKALTNLDNASLTKLNDAGAWIDKLEGHTFLQSHPPEPIKKAGVEKWTADILPLLDEASFNRDILPVPPRERIAYLTDTFTGITEGRFRNLQEDSSDQVIKMIGMPANLSKKLGQSRRLHFKDGEALFKYNELYGEKNLSELIHNKIQSVARNAALIETFGTNPRATFERLMMDATPEEKKWLNSIWAELDGSTSIPGKSTMAVAGNVARVSQNLSKLGKAMISSIPDIAMRSANLFATNGMGMMQSLNRTFFDGLKNIPEGNRNQIARMTGVGIDAMMGKVYDRFSSYDSIPGKAAKANEWMMRLSGLKWWTDANRAGHAQTISWWLGANAQKDFAKLPQAKNLQRYGIGVPEWELLRNSVESFKGDHYISVDAVEKLRIPAVKDALKRIGVEATAKQAEAFKRVTRDKLATYFSQEVKTAMNEAGPYERAFFLRGTQQDEVLGQAARFIQQFKTYPLTVLTKSVDDVILGNGSTSWSQAMKSGTANFQGLAYMMVGTTLMAYVAESFRAAADNKTPPDASRPETWMKMVEKSGMMGLYGDFLMGEYDSRFGRNALESTAGPVAAQVQDMLELKTKLMNGDKAGTQAMRMLVNNTPGANLFWLRGAADYLMLNSVMEHINPGYLERTKDRLEKTNQNFLVEPE